jgi:hypothetical protein
MNDYIIQIEQLHAVSRIEVTRDPGRLERQVSSIVILNHHNAIARQASLVCGNENASGERANVGAGVLVDAVG